MKTNDQNASKMNEIIVDVRTEDEWKNDGHSNCSVNYPLDQFDSKIEELKKYDKVILVCRSGGRAGVARAKLLNAGYKNKVENLGPWQNIVCPN
ncbi:MAG: rhodanese-like domain-containing protein [Bacteroidia bacterium]